MSETVTTSTSVIKPNKAMLWTGRVITALMGFAFVASGVMKLLASGPEFEESMAQIGMPVSIVVPLAILELTCVVIYLIPRTSMIGAILLTGYMGGAICTHWRVGDVFVVQIVIGVLVWLGLYLREPRLWALMPFKKSPAVETE